MPRGTATGRMLWPDAALSRSLARCSIAAQLLFDRLVSLADDQGRQPDGADVVAGSAFPLLRSVSVEDVEGWLAELAGARLVIRYVADDEPLIQLRGWWEWQRLEWARPSKYPAPDGWSDRVGKRPATSGDDGSSGSVRTGPEKEKKRENQNQNEKGPDSSGRVRTSPDSGRSFREAMAEAGFPAPTSAEA